MQITVIRNILPSTDIQVMLVDHPNPKLELSQNPDGTSGKFQTMEVYFVHKIFKLVVCSYPQAM